MQKPFSFRPILVKENPMWAVSVCVPQMETRCKCTAKYQQKQRDYHFAILNFRHIAHVYRPKSQEKFDFLGIFCIFVA